MIISATNIVLRPNRSDRPPRPTAPTGMPNRLAAPMTPCSAAPRLNSLEKSGSATPVMKTTKPSKNLPAAASDQISHCIPVMGGRSEAGAVGPHRQFVDVLLHGLRAGVRQQLRPRGAVHSR